MHWVHAELTDPAETAAAVGRAADALGGLDALVCLAGGFGLTTLDESGWDDFARLMELSYQPTVVSVLACLPHLGDGSSIVTIGARVAVSPGPRAAGHGAAKAAVVAFSASAAAALRPRGVRLNCVLPGTLDTPSNRASMPETRRGSWVPPRQLGELIRFLASPESAPLTGAAIPIG